MTGIDFLELLGGAALKAAVILALAGVVSAAWRSASAASRHLVWTLAVTAALAVPLMGAVIARLDAPQIEIAAWTEMTQPATSIAPEAQSLAESYTPPVIAVNDRAR